MSAPSEFELLGDLAKLLKKYGPEAFTGLAERLSSPEFVEQLIQILSTSAQAARQSSPTRTRKPAPESFPKDFRFSLVQLEKTDSEKSAFLVRLYDQLMAKAVLPTLQELRSFALSAGLPPLKATSRPKAVVALLEGLSGRTLEELQKLGGHIEPTKSSHDRSLENWTRIILDKDLPSRRAE